MRGGPMRGGPMRGGGSGGGFVERGWMVWLMVGCQAPLPIVEQPTAPVPSCPDADVEPPEVDPGGTPETAFDLGPVGDEPVRFCGAIGDEFADGWLFSLVLPSVVDIETTFCDCTGDSSHVEILAVDPAPQVVGAGSVIREGRLEDLPPVPLGPGVWMLRLFDPGSVDLDYVAQLSATPAPERALRTDAPSDFLGAPLVGGVISGWTGYPIDEADVLLVQIEEPEARLRFTQLAGEFVTVSLATDENGDGANNQAALQQDRIEKSGQAVTYEVPPGFYYLEIFGGPAVYTIAFEEGFGVGAPF